MFNYTTTFSGFSVDDLPAAKKFYGETLEITVEDEGMGLTLKPAGGNNIFVYPKDNHEPATFTILNFVVDDIDKSVEELTSRGIQFEHYDGMPAPQDEKGILRGLVASEGPDIAWFKDPAGNVLAVLQDKIIFPLLLAQTSDF